PFQHLRQVPVGAGNLAAAVDQKDNLRGIIQRDLRLPQYLARDVFGVVDDDAAGVDQFEAAALIFGESMNAVACDARLIPHDGTPLTCNAIEESGLSNIGPAHDDYCG